MPPEDSQTELLFGSFRAPFALCSRQTGQPSPPTTGRYFPFRAHFLPFCLSAFLPFCISAFLPFSQLSAHSKPDAFQTLSALASASAKFTTHQLSQSLQPNGATRSQLQTRPLLASSSRQLNSKLASQKANQKASQRANQLRATLSRALSLANGHQLQA